MVTMTASRWDADQGSPHRGRGGVGEIEDAVGNLSYGGGPMRRRRRRDRASLSFRAPPTDLSRHARLPATPAAGAERARSSLDAILKPRTIAVIGASRSPNTIGNQILSNLVTHGFTGAVFPVNPTAKAIHAIRAYPDVALDPRRRWTWR